MEESNKENNLAHELLNNRVLVVESLQNSQIFKEDVNNFKQNIQDQIYLNDFYMKNFEQIHKLQTFFKKRYSTKSLKEFQCSNQFQKLQMENTDLRNENFKLKSTNKILILEMLFFIYLLY